ncbi:UDP-glucose 4-epimerase [Catalinimonas alkaloidigena]|uniref:UDP-glucose 4-epimerase n=1 Tax=Catalinimonas alkaloidigena TaxID=1075417 RepID=A0A1G9MTC8_9BACT|nr:SDR family oxidoreductase [Catalinimonas alkaloidigena]SDL77556.1 UDP-glucose 4-epimerase [Catalinimonas alkaloidigena]
MHVLITGGAGYVGTELVNRLTQNPDVQEITIYDNLSRKNYNLFMSAQWPDRRIRFVLGDLLDSRKLKEWVKKADVIYHLAAKVTTPFSNDDPHIFEQVNHWGTAELSYLLEELPPRRIIYLSSTSIYGASEALADRNTPPQPRTYYGISKWNGEKMLGRLADQHHLLILRGGNVYGYSRTMRFDAVINKFMFEAQFNRRISINGSGEQKRSFIHIDQLCEALAKLLTTDLASGTYDLTHKNLSVLEILDTLRQIYPDLETLFIQQNMAPRSLSVLPDERLEPLQLFPETDLSTELAEFRNKFAFNPL